MTGYCNKCGETACSNKECESDIEAMAEAISIEMDNIIASPERMERARAGRKEACLKYAARALAASPVERLRTEMATAIRLIGEGHQDHAAERLKQALLKLPEDIRNG